MDRAEEIRARVEAVRDCDERPVCTVQTLSAPLAKLLEHSVGDLRWLLAELAAARGRIAELEAFQPDGCDEHCNRYPHERRVARIRELESALRNLLEYAMPGPVGSGVSQARAVARALLEPT